MPLAGAEVAGGDAEFVLNGNDDAAFAAAVEFGDDEAGEAAGGFLELAGLDEGVGAGGGVDDEEGFVGGLGVFAAEDALDFGEFAHEVFLIVEATGGVADEVLDAAALRGFPGVVADGGGVGFVLAFDDGDGEALGPEVELLDGGGAEGIGGGEHDGFALALEEVGEFGGAGGFADAIDADDEDDAGFAGKLWEGGDLRGQDFEDFFAADVDDFIGFEAATFGAQGLEDVLGHGDADVAADEGFLEFIEVDFAPREALEELFKKTGHEGKEVPEPGWGGRGSTPWAGEARNRRLPLRCRLTPLRPWLRQALLFPGVLRLRLTYYEPYHHRIRIRRADHWRLFRQCGPPCHVRGQQS